MAARSAFIHFAGPAGLALLLCLPLKTQAQEILAIPENVRHDWGQVLRVDPVHQTLRANRVERQCTTVRVAPDNSERGIGTRIVDAVRGVMGRAEEPQTVEECRDVTVPAEFSRPIAYDVEYSYRGVRYRSRLPFDPGHRIRLRVSVTPVAP